MQLSNREKQVKELEKLIGVMTDSALASQGKELPAARIKNELNSTLQRLDDILRYNFKLKQEIACEKKRYVDLMNAFLEVRHEQKINPTEISDSSSLFENASPEANNPGFSVGKARDSTQSSSQKWACEKSQMQ